MSYGFATRVLLSLIPILSLTVLAPAQSTTSHKCTESPKYYESNNYQVHDVNIDSPLGWLFGSVEEKLKAILSDPSMPIKKGAAFRKADEDEGFIKVKESFPELIVSPIDRIAVRVSKPTLQNCDTQTKTLDVVYRVYTIGFSYYLSRAFETGQKEEVKRSVVDTHATELLANYFPQPIVGYNHARNLYGGTKLSIKQPHGLLEKISLEVLESSKSSEEKVAGTGERDFKTGFLRHLEYQFRYLHSDIPGTSARLKGGSGLGQMIAATRTFGSKELVLRFGTSVEGGNQQTNLTQLQVLPGDLAQSPYGAVKAFAGGTMRVGKHAFKVSYGLQLGSARKGAQLDYVKQVFDTAANLRFLITDHRPITIDLQFTGGSIQKRGPLPAAERFFGGNIERNFIAGDTWIIRSDPLIRSFPQNSFAQTTGAGAVGGDGFFSTNITAAITIWGKPLVPREILDDAEFNHLIEFEFGTAETALKIEYVSSTPEFRKVAEMVNPISEKLAEIRTFLTNLEKAKLGTEIDGQIQLCGADIDDINETITKIKGDLVDGSPKSADVRLLVVGFPDKKPPIGAAVSELIDDLADLKDLAGIPDPLAIEKLIQELETRRAAMAKGFVDVNQSPAAERAAQQAHQVMIYPRRVFNELSREANLVAISPLLILDAARLRQRNMIPGNVRYAMGGGLRLSIVSLDLTAGYAWNPTRKPWESRGALLFSMEVSNLFR
jgi:hypothetical protein